jgi:exopolysaccharide biosynthesis polyprenyl glycosylphosphotransferase
MDKKVWILGIDFVTINVAWVVYYLVRVRSGWLPMSMEVELFVPMLIVYCFWLLLFFLVGLYRPWYAKSRFDELTIVFKTVTTGCLFLFFAIFVDDQGHDPPVSSRLLIAIYWGILLFFVCMGRVALRSIQRRMLIAGIGVHNTVIVGSEVKSKQLFADVKAYPALGYNVVGFATVNGSSAFTHEGVPVIGSVASLDVIIKKHAIQDVLVALDSSDHSSLLEVLDKSSSSKVGIKIIPDLYDIVSGQARTNQIYGFPLIDINPQLMPPWEESLKRMLDVCVSATVLLVGFPVWLFIALVIKLESPGPILYTQDRVGRDGKVFRILKFRSMKAGAEAAGPQWANKKDVRVTRVGKILRKLHLDEVPQLWNVLKGEMSLVGPRPERPVFVEQLAKEIPLYHRRMNVRPGITGWAQVKHKYDETIEDVRKKVQYDLFYIENMSLRMDFKILLSTVAHVLLGRGHT